MFKNLSLTATISIMLMSLLTSLAIASEGAPQPTGSERDQIKAAVYHMSQANERFVQSHKPSYFTPLIKGQQPKATVVTCSDSRVHTHALDQDPDGDLFMVREIGNQVSSGDGSVEYGVRHLHTPLLIIVGHSSCGAVKAAMGDYSTIEPAIKRELDTIKVSGSNAEDAKQVQASVESNVNNQVAYALKKFEPEITNGKLAVVGAVYDFRNDYKQGYGRLVIINFNGETDPVKIKQSGIFTRK